MQTANITQNHNDLDMNYDTFQFFLSFLFSLSLWMYVTIKQFKLIITQNQYLPKNKFYIISRSIICQINEYNDSMYDSNIERWPESFQISIYCYKLVYFEDESYDNAQ